MGASQSVDPSHIRIWQNLCGIRNAATRAQMLETLFSSPEYIASAKRTGTYAYCLQWLAAYRRGEIQQWAYAPSSVQQPQQQYQQQYQQPQQQYQQPQAPRQQPRQNTGQTYGNPQNEIMHHPAPQKAHDYFTECCDMLGLDESQPLSSELIKSAYKRAAVRAHPDRGGNAALFDAVTRASAYLQKIVDRVAGIRRQEEMTTAHVPNTQEQLDYLGQQRTSAVQQLQDRPPVALSPKNLDMSMFNQLFEENKLPDPEKDDGYGDWLKSTGQNDTNRENSSLKKKFALDTFNKTFEQEAGPTNQRSYVPSAIILQPTMGITLGGEKPADYTSPYGGRGVQFTDLKSAYTTDSTFSQNVSDAAASIGSRPKNLKEYERERAVTDLSPDQKRQVLQYEQQLKAQEDARVRRAAQQDVMAQRYHEQMQRKLLVEK